MYLEYCNTKLGNFGDDLNPWMFPKLLPQAFENPDDSIAFLGIGTILDQTRVNRSNLKKNKANIVFSSGAGFGTPPKLDDTWHIYCVRGEHTARQLGVSKDKVIADGAYLLRNLINYKMPIKKYKVAFIPHHSSEDFINWAQICKQCGIKFISTRQPVETFIDELLSAEKVLTEAMHGAIVADALRVPWVPVSYSPKFMPEKWHDFANSLNINLNISKLPFYVHYPLNVGQSIEHSLKRGLSKAGIGPMKWKRLPNAYTKASNKEIDNLCKSLLKIDSQARTHQSKDSIVELVTEQLSEKIQEVHRDFLSGKMTL